METGTSLIVAHARLSERQRIELSRLRPLKTLDEKKVVATELKRVGWKRFLEGFQKTSYYLIRECFVIEEMLIMEERKGGPVVEKIKRYISGPFTPLCGVVISQKRRHKKMTVIPGDDILSQKDLVLTEKDTFVSPEMLKKLRQHIDTRSFGAQS